jgi:ubiquinone/menaquinone biosynthesis C-methylase UbiE
MGGRERRPPARFAVDCERGQSLRPVSRGYSSGLSDRSSVLEGPRTLFDSRHCQAVRVNDDARFDSWSRWYDKSPAQIFLFGPIQQVLLDAVRAEPPGPLLDIGCGTGRLIQRFDDAGGDRLLVGIDCSEGMLRAARRARLAPRLLRAPAEHLPFGGQVFAVVASTVSFHHWSDQPKALDEVHRVLKPGGLFALADVTVDDIPALPGLRPVANRIAGHPLPALDDRHKLLEHAGLKVADEMPTILGRIRLTLSRRPH